MSRQRVILWACYASVLTLLGVVIYYVEQPEPLWAVDVGRSEQPGKGWQRPRPVRFSADGRWLYLILENTFDGISPATPRPASDYALQVRDARTGNLHAVYPKSGCRVGEHAFSADGRFYAALFRESANGSLPVRHEYFVCLIDLINGKEHRHPIALPNPPSGAKSKRGEDYWQFHFSSCSSCLAFFRYGSGSSTLRIYDLPTGEVIHVREMKGNKHDHEFAGDRSFYQRPGGIEVWSVRELKMVGVLPTEDYVVTISPDGQFVVTIADDQNDKGVYTIWNVDKMTRSATFPSRFERANDYQFRADWLVVRGLDSNGKCRWERRELATGRLIETNADAPHDGSEARSPDGRLLAVYSRPLLMIGFGRLPETIGPDDGLRVYSLDPLRQRWAHVGSRTYQTVLFTRDSKSLIVCQDETDTVDVLDADTGALRRSIPLAYANCNGLGNGTRTDLTRDGATLLIAQRDDGFSGPEETLIQRMLKKIGIDLKILDPQHRDVVIVFDVESLKERFRLQGWNISWTGTILSDDGRFVVTEHAETDEAILRCWDVNAFKPLRWPIGIPAALGASLVLLAKAWRRWRRPTASPRAGAKS